MNDKAERSAVHIRSSGLCERMLPNGRRCMAPATDNHHIVPKGRGGRHGLMKVLIDSRFNRMDVCRGCHIKVPFWDEDADSHVPGKVFRDLLKKGLVTEAEVALKKLMKGERD